MFGWDWNYRSKNFSRIEKNLFNKMDNITPYVGFGLALVIPASQFIWPITKNAGANVVSRPPPAFFGVIWSIIVVIIGIVWYMVAQKAKGADADDRKIAWSVIGGLTLAIFFCLAWMAVYNKNKKFGVYIMWMLVATLIATALATVKLTVIAADLLVIPITWAIYASVMGMLEIQTK